MARLVKYWITGDDFAGFEVDAIETSNFRGYHLDSDGRHYTPDRQAIRARLIPQHRAAFDRAGWWFPLTLRSALSGIPDVDNACRADLFTTRGRLLDKVYATPFLKDR